MLRSGSGKQNQHCTRCHCTMAERCKTKKVPRGNCPPVASGQHKGYGTWLCKATAYCCWWCLLPGLATGEEAWVQLPSEAVVTNSHAQPRLITSQRCSQRLMALCLRPDQPLHVTVLTLVSWEPSALAASGCWQGWPALPLLQQPTAQCLQKALAITRNIRKMQHIPTITVKPSLTYTSYILSSTWFSENQRQNPNTR